MVDFEYVFSSSESAKNELKNRFFSALFGVCLVDR